MAENSNIEWTDHTFNPVIGCTKVAPGCANCYAEADFDKRRHVVQWGPHGTRVKTSDANWKLPLKWNRQAEAAGVRKRVFCASLADVFEDWSGAVKNSDGADLFVAASEPDRYVPWRDDFLPSEQANIDAGLYRPATLADVRASLFRLIDRTPHLDWLLLTKRPENVRRMWAAPHIDGRGNAMDHPETAAILKRESPCLAAEWMYRPNVWLGTSISDQSTADQAIPKLLKCRDLCPVLFLSAEPLLGPIDEVDHLDGIDWVIVGGESGHNARPCRIEWIRSLVTQCSEAGVPCFTKQLGGNPGHDGACRGNDAHDPNPTGTHREFTPISLQDKKGGDWSEWPEDLRVRQFPRLESEVAS